MNRVALLLVCCSALVSVSFAQTLTLTGYLADRLCVDQVIAPDGANMLTGPQEHSVMCALLDKCIATGFTILTHTPTPQTTSYGTVYNLTTAGNAMAVALLRKLDDPMRKDLRVEVQGVLRNDGLVEPLYIQDAVSAALVGVLSTVRGYLADRLCIDQVIAPDGANMLTGPQEHSVMCALLDKCVATGFTVLEYTPGTTPTSYGAMYNVTDQGTSMAVAYLKKFPPARKDLRVTVTGVVAANPATIAVASISDDVTPEAIGEVTVTGYLADRLCVDKVIAPDGANMLTGPQEHSVMCALLPKCVASGFTILTHTPTAQTTSYGVMHNLTTHGNMLAVDFLKQLNDPMRKDLKVQVQGTIRSDGLLEPRYMMDLQTRAVVGQEVALIGYLADRLCIDQIIAPDGANMLTGPQEHSVMCALLDKCIATGYTLLMYSPGTTPQSYGTMYNFTDRSNAMAVSFLRKFAPSRKNLQVKVVGVVGPDNMIDVNGIYDRETPQAFGSVTLTGFLADRLCVDKVIAPDGANMLTGPQEHTVMCALLDKCVASGFTLLMHTPTAQTTSYGVMHNFTVDGNDMAARFLRALQDPMRKDLRVEIAGDIGQDGLFEPRYIKCVTTGMFVGTRTTLTGYLADRLCIDQIIAPDGANMLTGPQEHSVMCALLDKCIATGYTLLMYSPGTTPQSYGSMYNFTAQGNDLAVAFLKKLPPSRKNILVRVDAELGPQNMLHVLGMTDTVTPEAIGEVTVTGYLADRLCVDKVIAPDGANMLTGPQEHSVMCALLPKCVASGFTILTHTPTAQTTSYGVMHNLTAMGNGMAVAFLKQLNDPMRKDLRVQVKGRVDTDGLLHPEYIVDVNTSTWVGQRMQVSGYLADRLCIDQVIAPDGANMLTGPQEHSVMCALLDKCIATGFTVLRFNVHGAVPRNYGRMHNLTAAGNVMAQAYLRKFSPHRKDLRVTVEGHVGPGGLLDPINIRDDVTAEAIGEDLTMTGFLSDLLCVNTVIAPDGANMISSPQEHSVMCALLPECWASGFTLLMHHPNATEYGVMHNFTESGNTLAAKFLLELGNPQRKNIMVTVWGGVGYDGLMEPRKIQDTAGSHMFVTNVVGQEVTVTGYLTDRLCLDTVIAPDGANMLTGPQEHSVMCALLDKCVATGFSVLLFTVGTAPTEYGPMYNLTTNGNEMAVAFLKKLPPSRKNILVTVRGTVASSNVLDPSQIIDAITGQAIGDVMLSGYLTDRLCVDKVIAPDGANMIKAPQDHTVMCALLPECLASGYTLLMQEPNPDATENGVMHNFTEEGNTMAVKMLRAIEANGAAAGNRRNGSQRGDLKVSVGGSIGGDGLLQLSNIRDVLSGTSVNVNEGKTVTVTGYLADRLCIDTVIAPDGSNMLTGPQEHTVMCALLPKCVAQGFTVLMFTPGSAPTEYGTMHNLTVLGNVMAENFLRKLPLERTNIRVTVQGALGANNVLDPVFIMDTLSAHAIGHVTLVGYLSDLLCVNKVIAPDGANMLTTPQNHTVMCALLPECQASGFTLLMHAPSPVNTRFGVMHNFTANGNAMALRLLNLLPPSRMDIRVQVTGTILPNGLMDPQSLRDLNSGVSWPSITAGASGTQPPMAAFVTLIAAAMLFYVVY